MPRSLKALITLGIISAAIVAFLWVGIPTETVQKLRPGVTFSQTYATSLGLNWREVLAAALDDLDIRHFRIPAYWSVVQPSPDHFDWSSIDFQLDELARRQATATLAIGLKLPRWPECWAPHWVGALTTTEEQAARLTYLKAAVERYRQHPAVTAWQVENEVFFEFGECPPPDRAFYKQEIALVRELDPTRPIYTTDSGELTTWLRTGPLVDRLGVSVYRVVRMPSGSVWPYNWIPPYWYARRAALIRAFLHGPIYISEFQMEPWVKTTIPTTPLEEQFETMDVQRMHDNFRFAEQMHITDISFWGIEWWWWMKTQQHDDRFWETARLFFAKHPY